MKKLISIGLLAISTMAFPSLSWAGIQRFQFVHVKPQSIMAFCEEDIENVHFLLEGHKFETLKMMAAMGKLLLSPNEETFGQVEEVGTYESFCVKIDGLGKFWVDENCLR